MSQFGRPSTDAHIGNWEDQLGGTSLIYQAIDEVSPSDSDYVTSEYAPANSPYVTKLSAVTDPNVTSGHYIRFRTRKDPATGSQVDLTVELREGYVSEASQGTLIATTTIVNVPNVFTEYFYLLSAIEAGNITDYSDLFLRFVANQP